MMSLSRRWFLACAAVAASLAASLVAAPARAQNERAFSAGELVNSGHSFFGNVSRGLALTVEEAVRRWGEPNGYILGQEASGAFVGGLRFGDGSGEPALNCGSERSARSASWSARAKSSSSHIRSCE